MALPQTLTPTSPLGSDAANAGDDQIRDLKQLIADVFGLPVSPTAITAKLLAALGDGTISLQKRKITIFTSTPQTLDIDHDTIILNTAGAGTLNFPAISSVSSANGGKIYTIINIGAGTWTLTPNGGDTSEVASLVTGTGCVLLALNTGTKWWSIKVSYATSTLYLPRRGCLVYKGAIQTISTGSSTPIVFGSSDGEEYDTDSIHSPTTNNTRLTVPTGVTKVCLEGNLMLLNSNTTGTVGLWIQKNGSVTGKGLPFSTDSGKLQNDMNVASSMLIVSGGDYFELIASQTSGVNATIPVSDHTWFALRVIE